MTSPIRAAPARLPPHAPAEGSPPVRLTASSRLMQWIIQVPPPPAAEGPAAATPRPSAGLRPADANRVLLRDAIERHLPPVLQPQLGFGREVSGSLRAAINLSCDHADSWMRRTLAQGWRDRALTPSEVLEGVGKAEAFAAQLLNEADALRLHALIFTDDPRPADPVNISTLG